MITFLLPVYTCCETYIIALLVQISCQFCSVSKVPLHSSQAGNERNSHPLCLTSPSFKQVCCLWLWELHLAYDRPSLNKCSNYFSKTSEGLWASVWFFSHSVTNTLMCTTTIASFFPQDSLMTCITYRLSLCIKHISSQFTQGSIEYIDFDN